VAAGFHSKISVGKQKYQNGKEGLRNYCWLTADEKLIFPLIEVFFWQRGRESGLVSTMLYLS
jgi:hypothetical protein